MLNHCSCIAMGSLYNISKASGLGYLHRTRKHRYCSKRRADLCHTFINLYLADSLPTLNARSMREPQTSVLKQQPNNGWPYQPTNRRTCPSHSEQRKDIPTLQAYDVLWCCSCVASPRHHQEISHQKKDIPRSSHPRQWGRDLHNGRRYRPISNPVRRRRRPNVASRPQILLPRCG